MFYLRPDTFGDAVEFNDGAKLTPVNEDEFFGELFCVWRNLGVDNISVGIYAVVFCNTAVKLGIEQVFVFVYEPKPLCKPHGATEKCLGNVGTEGIFSVVADYRVCSRSSV